MPRCHILREDPDLAEGIEPARREQAIEECMVEQALVPTGPWKGPATMESRTEIGLLVLDGLVIRRLGIDERFGAELLGEGDLLRPWQSDNTPTLALSTLWSVVHPLRLAVLDGTFVPQLARYPELAACLVARAVQRSRNLAVNMAIIHQARVDVRLHMLLWHLAARWGRVRSDGTILPLRLTHALLAELVAARRPTVTSALSDLARRGLVRSEGDSWVLSAPPQGQGAGLDAVAATAATNPAH